MGPEIVINELKSIKSENSMILFVSKMCKFNEILTPSNEQHLKLHN